MAGVWLWMGTRVVANTTSASVFAFVCPLIRAGLRVASTAYIISFDLLIF